MGLKTKKIIKIHLLTPPSAASERVRLPAMQQEQQESGLNEVGISLFVDKDRVPWVFPQRKFARKPCTSVCKRPPVSSMTFGKDFPAADVASKSRRPSSLSHPQSRGVRMFRELLQPESDITQGQGRVNSRGRVPREHLNPRCHPQGQQNRGRVCPLSCCTPSSQVFRFPCICPYVTRRNKKGSCLLEKRPEQEDTPSSPLSSMELKFELDT